MANLIVDDSGRPLPQFANESTGAMEALKGALGGMNTQVKNEVLVKPAPEANQLDALKTKIVAALPAGTNKIGSVDIASPIPTGTNSIGLVGLQGQIPAGTNLIGKVNSDALGALGDAAITNPASAASIIALLKGLLTIGEAAIPAGTNTIGNVKIVSNGLEADVIDDSLSTIDHMHKEIHEGNAYVLSRIFPAIANDAYAEFRITTGSNVNALPHLSFEVTAELGKAYITLQEGTTFTANGTIITPVNLRRSSTNVSANTFYHTPTVNVAGTNLYNNMVGSTGGQKQGGNIRAGFEFDLKPSTEFVFRVQNKSGSAQDISIVLSWYEMIT